MAEKKTKKKVLEDGKGKDNGSGKETTRAEWQRLQVCPITMVPEGKRTS